MSFPASLNAWLALLERRQPPHRIALGLERVHAMAARLNVMPTCPVITVTGTNGKGSVSALIAAMLRAGGYRVGLYMSPHLLRYNERVRLDGVDVGDEALCEAFAAVETERTTAGGDSDLPLTYFEFGTLAAFWLFARAPLDAWVLEVGLGGRLDAVNGVDADVALVTAVDIDHTEYLGDDREAIGYEKVGIARCGRPLICGDACPPESLRRGVAEIGAQAHYLGVDFGAEKMNDAQWRYWRRERDKNDSGKITHTYPPSALAGEHQYDNAAMAITALEHLSDRLPLSSEARAQGLRDVRLAGRLQIVQQQPFILCDVAHNPHAARALAAYLRAQPQRFSRSIALLAMLSDKDATGVVASVRDVFSDWWVAPLPGPRGGGTSRLLDALATNGIAKERIRVFDSVTAACAQSASLLAETDRMIVLGSFLTVSEALSCHHGAPR